MPTLIWSKVKDGLDPSMKKKAYAFFEKLQEDDTRAGLHIEPIVGSVDARVRTGKVDDNFRCVLFKITSQHEPVYVIHGVWPHDKANKIAEKVRLSMNPINGVPEVEQVLEEYRSAAAHAPAGPEAQPVPVPSATPPVPEPDSSVPPDGMAPEEATPVAPSRPVTWPEGLTGQSLYANLGIERDLASAALAAATESALMDLVASARVEWQGLALLDLATGSDLYEIREKFHLDDAQPVAAKSEDEQLLASLKRPAAKASFVWVEDNDELRRIIDEGDLGAWRLFLHPEQRTFVDKDTKGAMRLSGGAGTGKTVVAVHRAARLAADDHDARILLTTYTRNLADDLARSLRRLDDSLEIQTRLGQAGVMVKGIDQIARAVVQRAGSDIAEAAAEVLGEPRTGALASSPNGMWQNAIEDSGADLPSDLATPAFLEAEYGLIILPNRITSGTAYARVRRQGRGVALDRAKRREVWKVVEAYRAAGRAADSTDFQEKAALASAWLRHSGERLFDHVLVDEAQDLTPAHLQLLRALVPEGQNDLFICEDSHQRIYGHKVVLSHCGISIRGRRSRRLTLNYRTTAQNLDWAMNILSGGDFTDLEGEDEDHNYHSARSGPVPLLLPASSVADELSKAADLIRSWLPWDGDLDRAAEPEAIAVLVRDRYRRDTVVNGLAELGLEVRSVDREGVRAGKPIVMTMHRAKGLEFTHVLLFGVQEGAIPRGVQDYNSSEEDRRDALLRERSLIYVAATRARDVLAVTWSGERSSLLQ